MRRSIASLSLLIFSTTFVPVASAQEDLPFPLRYPGIAGQADTSYTPAGTSQSATRADTNAPAATTVPATDASAQSSLAPPGEPSVPVVENLSINTPPDPQPVVSDPTVRTPTGFDSQFEKARQQEQESQLELAIDTYRALIRQYPSRPEAFNNLARIYARQGDLDRAIELLQSGLATHPVYLKITENLGQIYSELARQAYRRALIEPGNESEIQPFTEAIELDLSVVEYRATQSTEAQANSTEQMEKEPKLIVEADVQGSAGVSAAPVPVVETIEDQSEPEESTATGELKHSPDNRPSESETDPKT